MQGQGKEHKYKVWRTNTQHNDIRHNDTQHKGIICDIQHNALSITTLCHNAECHYDECRILFIAMPNVCEYC